MFAISSMRNPVEIRTFVFFDLETTGFVQGSSNPRITEISIVATSRNSLLNKDESLPRVMHKLTIPLQPFRLIPLNVSQLTGLYNDLLEEEQPFDENVCQMLSSFISRLRPPVCFVAHNGDKFDYPILLSEFNRMGKSLSEDILCIDSLAAFRILFSYNDDRSNRQGGFKPTTIRENFNMFDDGLDAVLSEMDMPDVSHTVKMDGSEAREDKCEMNPTSRQKLNETTPTHQIHSLAEMNQRKVFNKVDGFTAKKRLPFTCSRPINFQLPTVYEHLVGKAPPQSHSAEADCLALLTCAIKIGDPFMQWADRNASPLVQLGTKK